MNFTQKWNIKFRDTFLILNLIVAFTVLGYLEISENKIKLAKEDKEFFFFCQINFEFTRSDSITKI